MALARLKIPIFPVKAHIAGLSVVASLILLAGLIQPALSLGETPSEPTGTPLAVHPENPHYYIFQGKPTVLITSAEHYGAVVNKDFDYVAYLDTLHSYGLNYTRIYPGFLFEPIGKFGHGNTLGVKPASLILPWARSNVPGYALRGNKFDLNGWDPEYFRRLKDFVARAREQGVVVEICFFNAQYSDTWPISPLYYQNNIQGVGKCEFQEAQTLRNADLAQRESDYVRKITQEVNASDNIVLEICDEAPDIGNPPTPIAEAAQWVKHLVKVVKDTEANMPKQHLIAQQMEGPIGGPFDFVGYPDVSIIVTQYIWEAGFQMGGMKALDYLYGRNKPIELNETAYYPFWYKGDKVGDSRVEAWEFMVGGGASFNHLNGVYTVENPTGKTPDNERVLSALKNLREFIYSFDFLGMHPDISFVRDGIPPGTYCRGMSEVGKQYALYHHHSTGGYGSMYTVTPGVYTEDLVVDLPAGTYEVDWVDPAIGTVLRKESVNHHGGSLKSTTPKHTVDIALRVKRS
jgi:hypothetical protein